MVHTVRTAVHLQVPLEVLVTHPSYNDKNPPCVFFFNPCFKISFLKSGSHDSWLTSRLTLDLPWVSCELSPSSAGEDKMSQIKRFKCLVVGCNNEYSSRQLLPTSEMLKTQRINVTLILKWISRSPICLNVSMFARVIRNPAISAEEVCTTRPYEICLNFF